MALSHPSSGASAVGPFVVARAALDDAFYPTEFCFDCGLRYLNWRAYRDLLEAADLAVCGHLPNAELDDDPAFADALDLIYLYLFRGPFE